MFYLYQITNLINGKIYVGVRKSNDPEHDSYMGSSVWLSNSINKYGVENFQKEILQVFETMEEAYTAESDIVTKDFVLREDTYNLNTGGRGGRFYMNANKTDQERSEAGKLGAAAIHSRSEEEKRATYKKISEANRGKKYKSGTYADPKLTSENDVTKCLARNCILSLGNG
jgi:hypothetical protein